jgi:hypothetical protein
VHLIIFGDMEIGSGFFDYLRESEVFIGEVIVIEIKSVICEHIGVYNVIIRLRDSYNCTCFIEGSQLVIKHFVALSLEFLVVGIQFLQRRDELPGGFRHREASHLLLKVWDL